MAQLTVVTRNVGDFSRFDVPLLNPFTSREQGGGGIELAIARDPA